MNKTEKKPKNIHFPNFAIGGPSENQNIASDLRKIPLNFIFRKKKKLTETENPPRISIVTNLTQQLTITKMFSKKNKNKNKKKYLKWVPVPVSLS